MTAGVPAAAQGVEPDSDRWTVSAGVVGGFDIHDVASNFTSSMIQDPNARVTRRLAPPVYGEKRIFSPTVGYDMAFMTPRVSDSFGQPRFFAHVNFEATLGAEVFPAANGARGEIRPPRDASGVPLARFSVASTVGQGSENIVDIDPFQIRAGAGVAFSFDLDGRTLRVKPSIEYVHKVGEARGGVTRIVQTGGPPGQLRLDRFGIDARSATVDVEVDTDLHGLGPGLEVELDAWRSGPTVVSVFVGAMAYGYLGDLKDEESGTTFNPANTTGIPEVATFRFRYSRFSYRANLGFRFRWQPEF